MKILLTGSNGMLGKEILLEMELNGSFQVLAPSRDELDLLNLSNVLTFVEKRKPDLIVHAAGDLSESFDVLGGGLGT